MHKFRIWLDCNGTRIYRTKEFYDSATIEQIDKELQLEVENMLSTDIKIGVDELNELGQVIDIWGVHSDKIG